MNLGNLNMSIELPSAEMWLAKSDKSIVAKITQRSGIAFSHYGKKKKLITHTQLIKLGSLGELDFSIPYQIEINHTLEHNPIVDLVNESSLIKCIFNGDETWFCVVDIKKSMDDNKDIMDLSCRSLNYELMRRYVRNFKVISNNLSSLCLGGNTINSNGDSVPFSGILSGTLWGISANTDSTFDTIYRSFDISKATALDALVQICQSFNAVPIFDTINRKISFQQIQNVGIDMGGKVSYGNFMRSLENESKTDLLVTRFVPYGKNGITISSINGEIFIDDFSFFLKGYTQDGSGNVLTSSPHMSDSLAKALTNYISLQKSHAGEFSSLLTTLSSQQVILTTKQNEMADLQTTLKSLEAQLDIAQTTAQPTATLLSQISSQNALIATKQTEIDTANANIASTNASIASLQSTLSINNSLSQSNQQELIPFIREQEWTDNSISDATDLYNQALVQFEKYKTPQITVKLSMVNIWEDIKSQFVWDKFKVGNDITVEYDVLGSSLKAKIIELSFDHQGGDVQIVLANWSDIVRQNEAISKMIFQGLSAANTLTANIDSWGQIDAAAKNINAIYNSGIDAAKIALSGGVSNTVITNNRGITVNSSVDATKFLRINNAAIGLTKDSGNTFSVAISPDGIFAPLLYGQILAGSNLTIANQAGNFSVNGSGATISDMTLSITRSDLNSRILLDPTNGIKIQAKSGGVFVDKFYADGSGNIFANSITLATPSINNGAIVGTSINVNSQFIVDSSGNLTANSATIHGSITSGSSITGASFSGGSISIGGSNFSVNSSGILTCNGATVNGTINATSGTLGNLTVTGTLSGGTISGTNITGGSVIGSTIKTSSGTGARTELLSNFGDINVYNASNQNIFQVEDAIGGAVAVGNNAGYPLSAFGTWNFTGTVTGLTTSSISGLEARLAYLEDHAYVFSHRGTGQINFDSKNVVNVDFVTDAS